MSPAPMMTWSNTSTLSSCPARISSRVARMSASLGWRLPRGGCVMWRAKLCAAQGCQSTPSTDLLDERNRVDSHEPFKPSKSGVPVRTLKIEEDGDYFEGRFKPKIRLMGRWLERAGFQPGGRASVTCLGPGILELRSVVIAPSKVNQSSPQRP